MSAALRIALTYFSGVRWQSWLNWGAGPMLGISLLWALATDNPRSAITAVAFAMFSVVILVLVPVYAGGGLMRMASTPTIMHLRPYGRRQMLLGATLIITVLAVLITLPAVVYPLSPLRITGKHAFDDLPPVAVFQFAWGSVAMLWVGIFALSSRPTLLPFCLIGLVLLARLASGSISGIPFEREQLIVMLFAAGVVAWIVFALWYLTGPSVLRRGMSGAWVSGTGQQAFGRFNPRNLFRRNAADDAPVSHAMATSQYLTGADSNWNAALIGALIAAMMMISRHFLKKQPGHSPLTFILVMVAISSATMTIVGVRRSRLLWLRAGLDRTTLFATNERHAWEATLSMFAAPVALFVTMAIVQQPDLAALLLLYTTQHLALAACAMYFGMTTTRGANIGTFFVFLVLAIVGVVALRSMDPVQVTSIRAHIVALILFGALAVALRSYAKSAWYKLDWRRAGPPLPSFGRNG